MLIIAGAVGGGVVLLLLLAIIISSLGSDDSRGDPVATQANQDADQSDSNDDGGFEWTQFKDRHGHFAVELPARPEISYEASPQTNRDTVTMFVELSHREYCEVNFAKFRDPALAPPPHEIINNVVQTVDKLDSRQRTIEREEWGNQGGVIFLEREVRVAQGRRDETIYYSRTCAGSGWVASMTWGIVKPEKRSREKIQHFFESFEVH